MSKKKNTNLVITLVLIILAVVTILPLFIAVMKSTATGLGMTTTLWSQSGLDVFKAAFSSDGSNLESGAAALYLIGSVDEHAFVVGVYEWSFIVSMIGALGCLVMSVLNVLNIKLGLINKLFAAVTAIACLIALIFSFIVAGYVTLGTGAVCFGIFLLIAGIAYAGLYFYSESK